MSTSYCGRALFVATGGCCGSSTDITHSRYHRLHIELDGALLGAPTSYFLLTPILPPLVVRVFYRAHFGNTTSGRPSSDRRLDQRRHRQLVDGGQLVSRYGANGCHQRRRRQRGNNGSTMTNEGTIQGSNHQRKQRNSNRQFRRFKQIV